MPNDSQFRASLKLTGALSPETITAIARELPIEDALQLIRNIIADMAAAVVIHNGPLRSTASMAYAAQLAAFLVEVFAMHAEELQEAFAKFSSDNADAVTEALIERAKSGRKDN